MRNTLCTLLIACVIAACGETGGRPEAVVTGIPNPAAGGLYPFLASGGANGGVLMAWLLPEADPSTGKGTDFVWSAYDGRDWSGPELITRGEHFFTNWADFPSLAAIDGAPLAAHWLQKVTGGIYAYHVNMAFRSESGAWSGPITPHRDLSATEHGFVSLVPIDQDRVFSLWLDGYRKEETEEGATAGDHGGGHEGLGRAMTLHSAMVHRDGSRAGEMEVDDSVCDCCQTAMARAGNRIIAVYRNRSSGEIRDIYRAVYDLDENRWSEPVALSKEGWEIAGCPVNGPQIAAHGNTVIAAWFTAVNEEPRSYVAVSQDGGLTFGEPQAIDGGASMGRVGVAFNNAGTALLTWIGSNGASFNVHGRFWRRSGAGESFVIGEIEGSRGSGFPRAAALGDEFLVAWTEPESGSGIRTVRVQSRP